MLITVDRFKSNKQETLSRIYIDGVQFCYGLEDEKRAVKVMKETRIPSGKYKLGVRTIGGFNQKYSARFPFFHKGMIEILNIPNFEAVLIHIGNTERDTAGCLLIGERYSEANGLTLLNSSIAYIAFYKKVINSVIDGSASIVYIDNDGV